MSSQSITWVTEAAEDAEHVIAESMQIQRRAAEAELAVSAEDALNGLLITQLHSIAEALEDVASELRAIKRRMTP